MRDIFRAKKWDGKISVKYKMSEKSIMYNWIVNALAKAGWAMTDDDNWSLLITSPHMTNEEAKSIQKNKKWNHFPGCYNLGRKDMLWKAMQLKINLFPVDYNIIPKSWIMPFDYKDFILNKDVSSLFSNSF